MSEPNPKLGPAQDTPDDPGPFRRVLHVRCSALFWPGLLSVSALAVAAQNASAQAPLPEMREARAQALGTITRLYDQQLTVTEMSYVSLSPDASQVAWSQAEIASGKQRIHVAPTGVAPTGKARETRVLSVNGEVSGESEACNEQAPEWAPDAHRLVFLSDCNSAGQDQLFVLDLQAASPRPKQLTQLAGYLSHPQWSADGGSIAFLYVEHASRTPSPMAAENRAVGVIDDLAITQVQRVAIVNVASGQTHMATPSGLYIFEFDWSPDGQSLAYTAAAPPGDDNWYEAQLYTQPTSRPEPVPIYRPKLQIALPRWSPDGASIAFIEGLMSDEGLTGGDIFLVSRAGGTAQNLTPDRSSSPAWLHWTSAGDLLFTEFVGGSSAISSLHVADRKTTVLWKGSETIQASDVATSLALDTKNAAPRIAMVRTSWSRLPEIWAGAVSDLKQVTHENDGVRLPLPRSEEVTWSSGGFPVQGWLLFPRNYDRARKYPMIVSVHGGPAWIATPSWRDSAFNITLYSNLGYFVFVPNVRGSYGQGERFTQANRRDWGFGDLQDLVSGVDEVVKQYPVDAARVGVIGWSYGASTAMMAVTRTHRFRAAVAGAGAVNMLSYYGQNSIDKWMLPYFGASVYDDPSAYIRCSAITYVKNASTPTLIVVGERDGEAPPAQSFEFWHALKELRVPTRLIVYADEGHGFSRKEDRIDLTMQAFSWFEQHMTAASAEASSSSSH